MFSRIEENNDMFQSGQRQVMSALFEQQSEIERKIRLTNEDIEDIEKYRNIEMQKNRKEGICMSIDMYVGKSKGQSSDVEVQ